MQCVEIKRISRQKVFGKLISILFFVHVSIVTIKYFYIYAEDINYIGYIFSIEHLNIMSYIIFIMLILEVIKTRRAEYDNKKICFSSNSVFSNKIICIYYKDITKITNQLGVISIRTVKEMITFDYLLYDKQELKSLLKFLETKTTKSLINPKMERKEFLLIIIALFLLFVMFLTAFIVTYII